jgi:hypothetical protein
LRPRRRGRAEQPRERPPGRHCNPAGVERARAQGPGDPARSRGHARLCAAAGPACARIPLPPAPAGSRARRQRVGRAAAAARNSGAKLDRRSCTTPALSKPCRLPVSR